MSKLEVIQKDKYPHYDMGKDDMGYYPKYELHFPKTAENFLEIGIWKGVSMEMFRDYYDGKGNFHAINKDWTPPVISIDELRAKGFICYEGDQGDIDFLSKIDTFFDVIIDDGSHHSDDQINTFKHLFVNNQKPGALYIIEDLHCCLEEYWWRGKVDGFENTMLALLKGFGEGKSLESQYFTKGEAEYFSKVIDKVVLYEPSIAFIWRK